MLLIFADDLTGALDAAAPFAGRGLATEVAIGLDGVPAALADAPAVLSVNLGCRDGDADEAGQRTRSLLALVPADTILFKKVDSRLKGHIAVEMDAMSYRHALVAPAIPDFGRIVVGGSVSGFGIDVVIPVHEKLGGHAGRCTIPDTRSQGDIREALVAAQAKGVDLLVGARGLAEALAEVMTGRTVPETAIIPAGKGLFVVGSRDPITVEQMEALERAGLASIIDAPNGAVPSHAYDGSGLTLVRATQGQKIFHRLSFPIGWRRALCRTSPQVLAGCFCRAGPRPKPCCAPWAFRGCVLPVNVFRAWVSAGVATNASLRSPAVLGKLTR